MPRRGDVYSGQDPRYLPFYGLAEAALCLRLPVATLRQWAVGRPYPTKDGGRVTRPLIQIADPARRLLSFVNLMECQALRAFRREHELSFRVIRDALASLKELDGPSAKDHPLAFEEFLTDRADIFVDRLGDLITLDKARQIAIRAAFKSNLQRIQRDADGPVAFFPWLGYDGGDERLVAVNPRVSFGRPVIAGTGISTAVIASFIRAGESVQSIAEDYDLTPAQVEAAVTFEEAA